MESLEPPVRPELDPEILEEEARLAARRAEVQKDASERAAIEQRMNDLALPVDAGELRRMARSREDAVAAAERLGQHRSQGAVLHTQRRQSGVQLLGLLGRHKAVESLDPAAELVERAWEGYVSTCSQHARQASEAARRPGLEQAVAQRQEPEEAHTRAVLDWASREQTVAHLAEELCANSSSHPALALRVWLDEQKSVRQSAAE